MVHGKYGSMPTKKCDRYKIAFASAEARCLRQLHGSYPSSVFRRAPPALRQALKRWVAAAKEIFICWATE